MNYGVFAIGAVLVLIGSAGVFGFIPFPLSIVNANFVETPSVACTSSNVCTTTVNIQNINASVYGFSQETVWFQVYNSLGQSVYTNGQTIGTSQSNFVLTNGLGTLASGSYSLSVFVTSPAGTALSLTSTTAFSTSNFALTVVNPLVGTITATSGGNSVVLTFPSFNSQTLTYASGASVTLTATNIPSGNVFSSWQFLPNGFTAGTVTVTTNPATVTMSQNYQAVLQLNANPTISAITIIPSVNPYPSANAGTITPASATVYATAAGGIQSATFTAKPNAGYAFGLWVVGECGGSVGSSASVTLTYSQMQACLGSSFVAGTVHLNAIFQRNAYLIILGADTGTGVTSTPAPGNYSYAQGSTATVTASGSCFRNWIIDGNVQPAGLATINVVMSTFHTVKPFAQCATLTVSPASNSLGSPVTLIMNAYPPNTALTLTDPDVPNGLPLGTTNAYGNLQATITPTSATNWPANSPQKLTVSGGGATASGTFTNVPGGCGTGCPPPKPISILALGILLAGFGLMATSFVIGRKKS